MPYYNAVIRKSMTIYLRVFAHYTITEISVLLIKKLFLTKEYHIAQIFSGRNFGRLLLKNIYKNIGRLAALHSKSARIILYSGEFRGRTNCSPLPPPCNLKEYRRINVVIYCINSCIKCHFHTLQTMMTHTFSDYTHLTPCFISICILLSWYIPIFKGRGTRRKKIFFKFIDTLNDSL